MSSHPLEHELHTRLLGVEERAIDNSQRLDNAIRNLVGLAAAVRQLSSKTDELNARLDTIAASMDLLDAAPAVSDEQIEKLFALAESSGEEVAALSRELTELREKLNQQVGTWPKAGEEKAQRTDTAALEKELGEMKASILSLTEKPALGEQLTALKSEIGELRAELGRLDKSETDSTHSESPQLQLQIAGLQEELNELRRHATELNELRKRTKELEQLAERVRALENRPTATQPVSHASAPSLPTQDAEAEDPSIKPLLESALHIQRGDIASAVAELEKASLHSDNPKLIQALEMARRMLAEQKQS